MEKEDLNFHVSVSKANSTLGIIKKTDDDDNDNDNDNGNDNDNDNILFDHNVQIEITIFNSLENQIKDWSRDYY